MPGLRSTDLDKIVFASDCPFRSRERHRMYTRETLRIIDGIGYARSRPKEDLARGNLGRRSPAVEVQELIGREAGQAGPSFHPLVPSEGRGPG